MAAGHGAGAELALIRRIVAERLADGAAARIPPDMTTVDLVAVVLQVALAEHEQLGRIRRLCVEEGHQADRGSALDLVRGVVEASVRAMAMTDPDVIALFKAAVKNGQVVLSRGAKAGLREALTGDSGAVEVGLTEHEVQDLVLSGSAFLEVGNNGHADVLVKVVDLTGKLRFLRPLYTGEGDERVQ